MLKVNSDALLHALNFLGDLIPNSVYIPMLENVHFCPTHPDKVTLSGADVDKFGIIEIPAEWDDMRDFVVPLKRLQQLVGQLHKEKDVITFSLDDKGRKLTISEGNQPIKLNLEDASNFRDAPDLTHDKAMTVNPGEFVSVLGLASFAQSDKLIFTGLSFRPFGTTMYKVDATNTLTGGRRYFTVGDSLNKEFVVPATIERPLRRMASVATTDWKIALTDRQMVIFGEGWILATQFIDGVYPDFERVYWMIHNCQTKLVLNKQEIQGHLKILSCVSDGYVTLELSGTTLRLSAMSAQLGNASRDILLDIHYADVTAKLTMVQLEKVLAALDDTFTLYLDKIMLFQDERGVYFQIISY